MSKYVKVYDKNKYFNIPGKCVAFGKGGFIFLAMLFLLVYTSLFRLCSVQYNLSKKFLFLNLIKN